MDRLTPEQRYQIVETYFQNQCSVKNVVFRALRPFYGRHNRPSETTIRETINKFRSSFTLLDIHPPNRVRRARFEANIAAVAESVDEDCDLSIRRRAQEYRAMINEFWLPN